MSTTIFSAQLTSSGFTRASMLDIKSVIDGLYLAAYGSDADLGATSPDGMISGGLSEMFDDLNAVAEDTHRGLTDPNAATGQTLSGMANLTGCTRNSASYSTAPATFSGVSGTVIDTTKVVQSTVDGSLWSPLATVTIGSGGTITGTLKAQVSGPPAQGAIPPTTLTVIQTPVTGWASVTNAVGTPGVNIECDPNLRVRRQQSVAIASQAMTDGLQAAIKSIPHISDAVVWENNTINPIAIGDPGNVINANSLLVFVKPDGDASVDPSATSSSGDPVANTIFALKGCGCGTQGNVHKFPVDAVGVAHQISYSTATALNVQLQIGVRPVYNWPTDGKEQIAALISKWAQGSNAVTGKPNIQIGGNDRGQLSWTDVVASFLGQVPGFDFLGLSFSVDGGSTWTLSPASLSIPFGSFAQISVVDVVFGG
jgi:hypothetical protein